MTVQSQLICSPSDCIIRANCDCYIKLTFNIQILKKGSSCLIALQRNTCNILLPAEYCPNHWLIGIFGSNVTICGSSLKCYNSIWTQHCNVQYCIIIYYIFLDCQCYGSLGIILPPCLKGQCHETLMPPTVFFAEQLIWAPG